MGTLIYGDANIEVQFEDRVLAHLQLAIGAKLRRKESFFFSWRDDPKVGDGRSAVWVDPSIPLYFKYSGGRSPLINREWLEMMASAAHSPQGLMLMDEPVPNGANGRATDNSMKP